MSSERWWSEVVRRGAILLRHPFAPSFCAILLSVATPAQAQFGLFGTNKIQYRQFEWRTLRGEHIDLYYYPEEEELARVALTYAEDSYKELEARFRLSVQSRVPLVVYASHYDFEQTNLLPFTPPEGLLGFTEFGRSRVALPFRGSYAEFRHTIKHEMVHVFQLARARLNGRLYPRLRGMAFPLWWGEGTAEYFSDGQDTQDEMLVRDITQSGNLPSISQLNWASGGAVYAIGGDLVRFLAAKYGEWRLVQGFDDAWRYDSFDDLLYAIYGKTPDELTAEWQYSLRRRYYPQVATQRPLALTGHRLAQLALKPAVWFPPGDSVAEVLYLSPRSGYTDILARSLEGGRERTVVKGERTPQLESFHVFDSRMDVSTDGVVVFSSRYMEHDALIFWDIDGERLVGRYQFPDVVSMLSPTWAPDFQSVVFSGLSVSGASDLYRLWLPEGRLERLTFDRYNDTDPSFSPDGTRLVFASDRTPFGPGGASNLFILDIATRAVRYLTYGNWHDLSPQWADDERITFTSDRRGVQDVYAVDSTGVGRRETGVPGGIYDPVWIPEMQTYVAGAYEGLTFSIYTVRPQIADGTTSEDSLLRPAVDTLFAITHAGDSIGLAEERAAPEWRWMELDDRRYANTEPQRYEHRYSLDFAGAEAVIAPGVGAVQGASFLVSDMLQDNIFLFNILAFQQGGNVGDFLSNINGSASYINQSRRLNWGLGVFRLRGTFYEQNFDRAYRETATGVFGLLRYPMSRFTRMEARMVVEYADRTDFGISESGNLFPERHGVVTSNYLSYVHDNSLWMSTGPIDGSRERITGGLVTDIQNARFDSWLMSADIRRYFRTGLTTSLALRFFGYVTGGERPQRITLGGSYGLRGYPRYTYVSGTQAWMINAEWRFPLTDYLSFGFPMGEWRFPGIQGAVFADIGGTTTPGQREGGGAIGAYGFSFRMSVGFPLVLRLDTGWRYGARDRYILPLEYRRNHFVAFWFGFNY